MTIRPAPRRAAAPRPPRRRTLNMYIIAIGWLYVTTLMALAETNLVAGVLTFVFYGLLPVGLLLWLLGTPARRQRRAAAEAAEHPASDRPGERADGD